VSGEGQNDDDNAPLVGHVVADRYFVEDRLGEGGMGTVYTARHVTLDKRVALKVLHGEFSRKPELVERFLQEAKAASSIRNEHVIDITDFGVTGEGFVFFTMEHLQGRDLHTLLGQAIEKGELLPWERSKNIFLQVCEALSAAHAMGIIHRDLKPENILLVDGTGRADYVKLLDFGIAKVESGGGDGDRKLTKTGMLFGTPEYMAPEQARGEKPDHRVDVYAMGCLLFQFLAGTVPFKADSFMAILTQHMVEPVPDIGPVMLERSGAPAGIVSVVMKALTKDREERYPDIASLAEAVAAAQSDVVVAATTSPEPAQKRKRKSPRDTDWTGSIRGIDALVEDEVEEDERYAQQENAIKGSTKLIVGIVAAMVLGGGAFAASKIMGGESKAPTETVPAVTETPVVDDTASPTAAGATIPVEPPVPAVQAMDAGAELLPPQPAIVKEPTGTAAVPASDLEGKTTPDQGTTTKNDPKAKGDTSAKGDPKPKGDNKPKGDIKPKGDDKPKGGTTPKDDKSDDSATVGDVDIKPFEVP
jgi:serine/threonine-protein kinase